MGLGLRACGPLYVDIGFQCLNPINPAIPKLAYFRRRFRVSLALADSFSYYASASAVFLGLC